MNRLRVAIFVSLLPVTGCSLLIDDDSACKDAPAKCAAGAPNPIQSPAREPACDPPCAEPTPCDPSRNQCVECLRDAHCMPPATCDTTQGRCIECSDARPCDPMGARRLCDPLSRCVECISSDDCRDGNVCHPEQQRCVACYEASDCQQAERSHCQQNECVACTTDQQCMHLRDTPACDAGRCVECTGSNETACGDNVCDVAARKCSELRRGLQACQACKFDSQCPTGSLPPEQREYHCVQLRFGSTTHGAYCLPLQRPACEPPYVMPISGVVSGSGVQGEIYCGVDQALTTCEAVLDFERGKPCTQAATVTGCGDPGLDDARCEPRSDGQLACTYRCRRDEECGPMRTCTGDMYCR